MEIFPYVLAKMLFVSFLFGGQLGVLFDIGRTLRLSFSNSPENVKLKKLYSAKLLFSKISMSAADDKKRRKIFTNITVFLSDLFLSAYAIIGLVIINYSYNDGKFRMFTVLGAAVGFLIYYFTFSKVLLFLIEGGFFFLKYAIMSIFDFLRKPVLYIYNKFVKKIKKMCGKFRFRIEKKKKEVYNVYESVCDNESSYQSRIKITQTVRKNQEGRRKDEKK